MFIYITFLLQKSECLIEANMSSMCKWAVAYFRTRKDCLSRSKNGIRFEYVQIH